MTSVLCSTYVTSLERGEDQGWFGDDSVNEEDIHCPLPPLYKKTMKVGPFFLCPFPIDRGTHFQVPRYIVYREDKPLWDCANMLGLSGSGTLSYAVLVYLCICIFVCAFDTWEYPF